MRKGKLVITPAKNFKPGDEYFDKGTKMFITVKSVDSGMVIGMTPNLQPCRVHPESLVTIGVKDLLTDEKFALSKDQWEYMYKTCRESEFKFFDKPDQINKKQIAVIFAKNGGLVGTIREIAPIVDAYGMYVASQKSIGEGAKNFSDWYFDISV